MDYFDEGLVVAAIVGLTQAAKTAGLPHKFAPLLSIALGIGGGLLIFSSESVLKGIVLGLTASGLYSGTKATVF